MPCPLFTNAYPYACLSMCGRPLKASLTLVPAGRPPDDLTYFSATQTPIPMTLSNMHTNGIRSLAVWWLGYACKVHEIVTAVVGNVLFPFNFRKITVIL